MKLVFRPARPDDTDAAVPLVYNSGPAAFDFVFAADGGAPAMDFLRSAFLDGAGEFGFRNHVVGELDGTVVATGAAWSGASNRAFTLAAARQILHCYGLFAGAGVMARGLRAESVIPPPDQATWYLAHLGVAPQLRGRGIGEALVDHLMAKGRDAGHSLAALDVAASNPRAQALYERLGFSVTKERRSRLMNDQEAVPDHRRMERRLADFPRVRP